MRWEEKKRFDFLCLLEVKHSNHRETVRKADLVGSRLRGAENSIRHSSRGDQKQVSRPALLSSGTEKTPRPLN